MFSLNKESLHLANVNPRNETHGDESVLAVDLKLEFITSNKVLLKFSPTLRDALYTQDPGATMDMINPDHAPTLRNPQMGQISWELEMPAVRFSVFADGTNEEDIVFPEAKCNKFRFTCKEGGTVLVGFRIQTSRPLEMDVTKLLFLMDKSIKVSLQEVEQENYSGEDPDTSDVEHEGPDLLGGDADGAAFAADAPVGETEQADVYDALYDQVKLFIADLNKVSLSILKRQLKLEGLIASRILKQLVEEGLVGEPNGQGMYDVLGVTA